MVFGGVAVHPGDYVFADTSGKGDTALRTVLASDATIADRLATKPDTAKQLTGELWFYYAGFNVGHDDLWPIWAPAGRLGWPEDQARVALFLASDMSSFVTGHNIPVDGGTKAGGGWFFAPSERAFTNRPIGL